MSRRLRLLLVTAGLVIMIASLAVLAYAMWPVNTVREQIRLVPTVFVAPQP